MIHRLLNTAAKMAHGLGIAFKTETKAWLIAQGTVAFLKNTLHSCKFNFGSDIEL